MKPKKNKKADLNNYTSTFLLIGLVMTLFIAYQLINLKTEARTIALDSLSASDNTPEENIQIRLEKPKPKIAKPKPKLVAKLVIVKDDSKKMESELLPNDPDDKPIPEPVEIDTDEVDETEVAVPFTLVEQVPAFPGCKGNNEQLKKCLNEKIRRFISKKFNTDIAQDLGLSGERVKILTQFTIDTKGNIIDIKTRSKYKDLEKEARRVIKKLPKMTPGKQRFKPVKVTYTLPIIFNVAEE